MRSITAAVIIVAGAFTVTLPFWVPPWIGTALLVLETLAYLVVSDIFLLARLGAYASVAVRELALSQAFFPGRSGSRGNRFTAQPAFCEP